MASDPLVAVTGAQTPRVGFVLEQTLGHITHADNLRRLITPMDDIDAVFAPIAFGVAGAAGRLPGFGNWTVRAGIRARRAITAMRRRAPLDALFIHTQVPAILARGAMRAIPTVVSLDATPMQYDELGAHYDHATGSARVEELKRRANVACFRRAAAVVTWAHWTRASLIEHYEVDERKIVVLPPGVDVARWSSLALTEERPAGAPRVLFVGGDFERKGGSVLLDAVRRLHAADVPLHVDVVTRDDVPPTPGVEVHHGLAPNSPELIRLYQLADVFCLPTLGDCLPMVLSEAGALHVPLVSTDVGAIGEIVRDGETGLLVPVGDAAALAAALGRLIGDEQLRRHLGDGAAALVRSSFDAGTNARALVDLLEHVAEDRP